MIKRLNLSIVFIALILVSCAGDVSSQTSSQPSSSNTFTVVFDSRGGSNVPNQIVEPNSFISPPNASKEGHTLEGWYTSINGGVTLENKWNFFSDRVNVNLQLYALWIANQYTITFETNGGTSIQPQTNNYNASLSVPNSTRVGYGFLAWFMDVGLTQAFTLTTMPASNLTLYAKWTINQYTITFETNEGSSIATITGNYGDSIIKPDDPTREGYTFAGWYADTNSSQAATVPSAIPASNLQLYALWTVNQYTITFETNGGTSIQPQTNNYNASLSVPNSTRVGYGFLAWFMDVGLTQAFTLTTMPASNLTLYAKWTINQYTITFETNEGSSIATITGNYGDSIIKPDDPTREGYTFAGWYADANLIEVAIVPDTIPEQNLTLYSKWVVKIEFLSLGREHSSAINNSNNVFLWGQNTYSQLGDGTVIRRNIPTDISLNFSLTEGDKFISLSLGREHSSALTFSGRVYMWGRNNFGQLGEDNTIISRDIPSEITSRFSIAEGDRVISVSLGDSHSSALTLSGRVFMWGRNNSGEIGDNTVENKYIPTEITSRFSLNENEKVSKLSLGGNFSSAVTSSGRVFMWGSNGSGTGQLGIDRTSSNKFIPTEITSNFSLLLGDKVISVALGFDHASALTLFGRVFMWGSGSLGQLGNGTTSNRSIPAEITSNFSLSQGDKVISVSLGGGYNTVLQSGTNHSSAITFSGRVFMWGSGSLGQLGDNTGISRNIPTEITSMFSLLGDDKIIIISLGNLYSSALTIKGRVFMWGIGGRGQLGDGTSTTRYIPTEITSLFA